MFSGRVMHRRRSTAQTRTPLQVWSFPRVWHNLIQSGSFFIFAIRYHALIVFSIIIALSFHKSELASTAMLYQKCKKSVPHTIGALGGFLPFPAAECYAPRESEAPGAAGRPWHRPGRFLPRVVANLRVPGFLGFQFCHRLWQNYWNYDEDRSRICTGHGPENITRLRHFAISIIKSKDVRSVPQKMRQLTRNIRMVFDYLRMTENSCTYSFQS